MWSLGAVLLFSFAASYFQRSEAEEKYAEMLAETEFGKKGAERLKLAVRHGPLNSDEQDDLLRYSGSNPDSDIEEITKTDRRLICRAGPGQIIGRGPMMDYGVACVWAWPRPEQKSVHAKLEMSNVLGAPPRADLWIDVAGADCDGNVSVRVSVAQAGATGPREQLTLRESFDWITWPALAPVAVKGTAPDTEIVYLAMPTQATICCTAGEIKVPLKKRLLIILAAHDTELLRWTDYAPPGRGPIPDVKLVFPMIDWQGNEYELPGWKADKVLEIRLDPAFDGTTFKLGEA
jgi:hypothetical protein